MIQHIQTFGYFMLLLALVMGLGELEYRWKWKPLIASLDRYLKEAENVRNNERKA